MNIKTKLGFCVLVLFVFLSSSCANKSYVIKDDTFEPKNWRTIAVMPLQGRSDLRSMVTDLVNLHMQKQNAYKVIQPNKVTRVLAQSHEAEQDGVQSVTTAIEVAKTVNADAAVIGNVASYKSGMTLNAFVTLKLVDTKTGTILATVHEPSGRLMAYSEQQCAVSAAENASTVIVDYLNELSKR